MDPLHVFYELGELWDGMTGEELGRLEDLSDSTDLGTLADVAAFVAQHAGEMESPCAMAKAYIAAARLTTASNRTHEDHRHQ
jgi:hypothetical protein